MTSVMKGVCKILFTLGNRLLQPVGTTGCIIVNGLILILVTTGTRICGSIFTKFCIRIHVPDVFLNFEFQKDRKKNVGAVMGDQAVMRVLAWVL